MIIRIVLFQSLFADFNYIIQFIKIQLQKQKLYVQDCHSNTQETDGAVTLTFDVLNPDSDVTAVKKVTAVFHIAENLSSDILLGCDVLRILGCKIDMTPEKINV